MNFTHFLGQYLYPATYTDTNGSYSIDYLNFKYFSFRNDKWDLISQYDSLEVEGSELIPEYADMNGDGVIDFCFKAMQGIRGANYYTHLLLFDTSKNEFIKIKGFENVCSPFYNHEENLVVGVGMSGPESHVSYYKISGNTILKIKKEVWIDDKLIKKESY